MVKKMMDRAASVPNLSESFTTEILDATSNITSQLRQSMKNKKNFYCDEIDQKYCLSATRRMFGKVGSTFVIL